MKHHLAGALLSALCCTLSIPAAAHGLADDRASFEDLLRELVDDRLSFEHPQRSADTAWQHAHVSLDDIVDPRQRWQHAERAQEDADDWRQSFSRWNRRWDGPDNFRVWHQWGRDWQHPHNPPAVPEPSGLALLAAGLVALIAARKRAV